MTVKNVVLFYEKVESDEVLQAKFQALQEGSEEDRMAKLLGIAKEEGFEISESEFKAYIQEVIAKSSETDELDIEDLDQVSGGGKTQWKLVSVFTFGVGCLMSLAERKNSRTGICEILD